MAWSALAWRWRRRRARLWGQLLLWTGGWRWVLAINLPLVGLAMAAGVLSLRQMADGRKGAMSTVVPAHAYWPRACSQSPWPASA